MGAASAAGLFEAGGPPGWAAGVAGPVGGAGGPWRIRAPSGGLGADPPPGRGERGSVATRLYATAGAAAPQTVRLWGCPPAHSSRDEGAGGRSASAGVVTGGHALPLRGEQAPGTQLREPQALASGTEASQLRGLARPGTQLRECQAAGTGGHAPPLRGERHLGTQLREPEGLAVGTQASQLRGVGGPDTQLRECPANGHGALDGVDVLGAWLDQPQTVSGHWLRCPFGCGGVLHKPGGPFACRWVCLRCRRRAVDQGRASSCPVEFGEGASVEELLEWCVARSVGGGHVGDAARVAVLVGEHAYWLFPLGLALALRDSVVAQGGVASETTVAVALFVWAMWQWEGVLKAAVLEPHKGPWWLEWDGRGVLRFARGDDVWEVGLRGALHGDPAPVPHVPPRAPLPGVDFSALGGAHAQDDEVLAGVALAEAGYTMLDPAQWLHVDMPGNRSVEGVRGAQGGSRGLELTPRALLQAEAWRIGRWLFDTGHVSPMPLGVSYNPWTEAHFEPPPVFERTVHRATQEFEALGDAVVHPASPLFLYDPSTGPSKLSVEAWRSLLQGHPRCAFLMTAIQWGQGLLMAKERVDNWVGATFPPPRSRSREHAKAIADFVAKEAALGRMRRVVLGASGEGPQAGMLFAPKPDLLWCAPWVVVDKQEPDGPPSFRACHDLSRPGPNGQPAPNESLDFRPLAPLTLASWVDLVQRYRYLRWAYPGVRILAARADFRSFYRQWPLRKGAWPWFCQEVDGEVWVHLSQSFGGGSTVHTCAEGGNALIDILSVKDGVFATIFVDDPLFMGLDVGEHEAESIHRDVECFFRRSLQVNLEYHPAKFLNPRERIPMIGFELDLVAGRARPTASRLAKVQLQSRRLLDCAAAGQPVTVKWLLQWAGLCHHLSEIVPFGRAHTAPVWFLVFRTAGGAQREMVGLHERRVLNRDVVASVRWWRAVILDAHLPTSALDIGVNVERPLLLVSRVRSDAASEEGRGLGGVFLDGSGVFIAEPWEVTERGLHINSLELLAATICVLVAAPRMSGRVLVLEADNTVCVMALRKEGTSSPFAATLGLLLASVQQAFRFTLRPHYCRGDMNGYADGASRGLLALPPGPGGAAWTRVRPSRAVRYLGTGSGPYLLPPPAPSPGHYAAVQIPRDYVTWADGLTAELLRASPPPWLTSSAGAQPEIPYVPFHPGWTTALRDAQGRPSL